MSYYSKCPNCGKQHHASFPYCEHCGATWQLNLSQVVMVNKEFRPTKRARRRVAGKGSKRTKQPALASKANRSTTPCKKKGF